MGSTLRPVHTRLRSFHIDPWSPTQCSRLFSSTCAWAHTVIKKLLQVLPMRLPHPNIRNMFLPERTPLWRSRWNLHVWHVTRVMRSCFDFFTRQTTEFFMLASISHKRWRHIDVLRTFLHISRPSSSSTSSSTLETAPLSNYFPLPWCVIIEKNLSIHHHPTLFSIQIHYKIPLVKTQIQPVNQNTRKIQFLLLCSHNIHPYIGSNKVSKCCEKMKAQHTNGTFQNITHIKWEEHTNKSWHGLTHSKWSSRKLRASKIVDSISFVVSKSSINSFAPNVLFLKFVKPMEQK